MIKHFQGLALGLVSLSGCLFAPVTPSATEPVSSPITGRLLLPTLNNRHLILKTGNLRIFKQNRELMQVSIVQNKFQLNRLSEAGPYTYQGQGIVETVQSDAVPIAGSQGGIVPISGSQGGFRLQTGPVAEPPSIQEGAEIHFSGQLQQNLNTDIAHLDLQVQPENIRVIQAENSIVNNNSTVENSTQTVIVGNPSGGIQVGNTPNLPPLISNTETLPSNQVTTYGQSLTLRIQVRDPEGKDLSCRWLASRGTLSSDTGVEVQWTALDQRGDFQPGPIPVTVQVKDIQGAETSAIINLIVLNSLKAETK